MANYRRPDVYIEEVPSFPISVQQIESAVPVFIGYTQTDPGAPREIMDWDQFEAVFGGAAPYDPGLTNLTFENFTLKADGVQEQVRLDFYMYYAIRQYFDNGGGKCFVISTGTYPAAFAPATFKTEVEKALEDALDIEEATLFVIPESSQLVTVSTASDTTTTPPTTTKSLDYADLRGVIGDAASQLLAKNKLEKFFILDMVDSDDPDINDLDQFDNSDFMSLATAREGEFMAFYYPYLVTTYRPETIQGMGDLKITINGEEKTLKDLNASTASVFDKGIYKVIEGQLKGMMPSIVLPPSAAMAGVYASVDRERGAWKAPANLGINNVRVLNKSITDSMHEDFNIDPLNQRSVCAIRNIPGYGRRILGARTLRGSSNEFRYISVRRFTSIVEKSIKNALKLFLFEPNNATTWAFVKATIDSFLYERWEEGALYGAKPEQAFFVRVALGQTMKPQDVLEGRMIVEIGLAVVRPAEFIILRFEQILPQA